MNIEVRQPNRAQKTRYGIVDCDIHPKLLIEDYRKYLSNQWWSHLQTYGLRPRHGYTKAYPMPKITPQAAPSGGTSIRATGSEVVTLIEAPFAIHPPA